MIDLHTHSNASDGTCTPSELVEQAKKVGIKTLALTDHDTIDGLEEARAKATELGLNFIAGIEFNIEVAFGEFHLLVYGMDVKNKKFLSLIEECTKNRIDRNLELCEMFVNKGIFITPEILRKNFSGQIGRPHFAKILKEMKLVKSMQEGFDKFLANGKPFYLKTKGLDFEKALSTIHNANGVAVLAHPMSLYLSWKNLTKKIIELKEAGIDGIEAWNAGTKPNHCRRLEKLGKELGLFVTAGSDFHGKNKIGHNLGLKSTGGIIEEFYYTDNLKPALENRKSIL